MVRAYSVGCFTIRATRVFSGPPMEEWAYSATLLHTINLSFWYWRAMEHYQIMGKTFDSFKREIGKNTGKAVSNFFFGDSHATPYRRVGSSEVHQARAEAQQTRAYTERERVRAQIEKQEQDDLNILDGAVLKNVDIVLQTPIPQDEAGLLNLMSIWAAQLVNANWNFDNKEGKIRSQYPDAVLEKFNQCLILMKHVAPTSPMAKHFEKVFKKAKKRRFLAKHKSTFIFTIFFGVLAFIIILGLNGVLD